MLKALQSLLLPAAPLHPGTPPAAWTESGLRFEVGRRGLRERFWMFVWMLGGCNQSSKLKKFAKLCFAEVQDVHQGPRRGVSKLMLA